MIPLLTHPLALLTLLSVPALIVIYRLRRRVQRRVVVSSLMLWALQQEPQDGGRTMQRFRASWLFLLELLILLLLCIAAVGPQWSFQQQRRPWIVVLDDSYSMLAGGDDSPRQQAVSVIRKELNKTGYSFVRFVLAREKPQVLGGFVHSPAQIQQVLQRWRCRAPLARLPQAVGFAMQLAGKHGRVLVLTDQLPPTLPKEGRLRWRALGQPRPNVAIVNASRSRLDRKDWCLLAVANLSGQPQQTQLTLRTSKDGKALRVFSLSLKARELRRITFSVPAGTPTLYASLRPDALSLDDHVTLLPQRTRPVRVRLAFTDKALQKEVGDVLQATQKTVLSKADPDILFTDKAVAPPPGSKLWVCEFSAGQGKSRAFAGPYVLHREHPLVQGLAMKGVIWSAGGAAASGGQPVLMVGNLPLITVGSTLAEGKYIRINLVPGLSNLMRTPNWPILIWNLLQWRQQYQPGFEDRNVRLGTQAFFRAPHNIRQIQVTPPHGEAFRINHVGERVPIQAREIGMYRIQAGEQTYSFAVNALSQKESDLSRMGQGEWGAWAADSLSQRQYRDMSWLFALLALSALVLHLFFLATQRREAP